MKLNALTLALVVTAFGAVSANAQTRIIEERPATVVVPVAPPAAVVVEPPATSTTVEHNNMGLLGNQTRTTTQTNGGGVDCTKQTVQTNTLLGSTSNSNTTCQ
ncbi:MAG: hypothetical protein ACRECC_09275 [Pseudolabrys sp.]|jgi:hypothetical protein